MAPANTPPAELNASVQTRQEATLDAQIIARQEARIAALEARVAAAAQQAPDLAPTATAAPTAAPTATPDEIAMTVAHLFGSALTLAITAATAQSVASAPADAAAHHLAARDPSLLAIADDERSRAGEVMQCLEGMLGLALLIEGDADDDEDRGEQRQCLSKLAKYQVNGAASQEQEEHWLARDVERNREEATLARGWQFVVPLLTQPLCRLLLRQSDDLLRPNILHQHGLTFSCQSRERPAKPSRICSEHLYTSAPS